MDFSVFQVGRVMGLVTATVLLLTIGVSSGAEVYIVSPNEQENTEGNQHYETATSSFKVQFLYPASDFGSMPEGGAFIKGHATRADHLQPTEDTSTFADIVITLSTTSLDSLTRYFYDNLGADATEVFNGSSSISYPVSGPAGGPNPFGADVEYTTPFFYDPSKGNLLVEIVTTTGNDIPGSYKDWQSTDSGTVLSSGNPEATFGVLNFRVMVRRFTIIPEPNSSALVMMGFVSLLCWGWRQGRRVV